MKETIVLGAGLQGVCAALALARAGHRVTLIDRASACLTRASLRNEGKIHLGFVYANDLSCRTSSLMLESALAFGPLLEEWIGADIPWARLSGSPFTYLVLRDSLVPTEQLMTSWTDLQSRYVERMRGTGASYLGSAPERLWWEPEGVRPPYFNEEHVAGVVNTAELAIDMVAFRELIQTKLREVDEVRCCFGHHVLAVERTPDGFRVEGTTGDGVAWVRHASTVVNCLWEGRLGIDQQMGLLPKRPWVYRLKYRLLGRLPPRLADLPSLTLMLGRFGDVVNYRDGRVYLSWYPSCLRGWSSDVSVPSEWMRACSGETSPTEAREIARQSLAAFDQIIPGFGECEVDSVAAGVIFSWGRTDIDDLGSELHRRDDIGPEAHDGYITVNTGKLTSAPLFARRILDLVR